MYSLLLEHYIKDGDLKDRMFKVRMALRQACMTRMRYIPPALVRPAGAPETGSLQAAAILLNIMAAQRSRKL